MITSTEIRALIQEETSLPGQILITNQLYSLPDRAYMSNLGRRLKALMTSSGLRFTENAWECDSYSHAATLCARIDHALTCSKLKTVGLQADPPERTAIAVGIMGIMDREKGAHVVNFAVHKENLQLKLCLYEPQKQLEPYSSASVEYYLFAYL